MTTVSDILTYLETLAPLDLAMDWDNPGLQLGDRSSSVTKVLVALDPFEDAAREAISLGAELIVTHHPLFFSPIKSLTEDTAVGRTARLLIRNNISLWSGHTNLDIAPGGVNDILAKKLGLSQIRPIPPENLLRVGSVPEMPLAAFLKTVKSSLGCPVLRYVDAGRPCRRIAVGGGACGSELKLAQEALCDTFVTSDLKYNQFWDAQDLGMNLIDSGHFYTENPVCEMLAAELGAEFPGITVKISESHRDCMKFF